MVFISFSRNQHLRLCSESLALAMLNVWLLWFRYLQSWFSYDALTRKPKILVLHIKMCVNVNCSCSGSEGVGQCNLELY